MDQKKPPPNGVGPPNDMKTARDVEAKDGGGKSVEGDGKKQAGGGHGTVSPRDATKTGREEKIMQAGPAERSVQGKVWGNPAATKALLFAPPPETSGYSDEQLYAAEYECARRQYEVAASDSCRDMTKLEARTLWLWRSGVIKLSSPPNFTNETHTLRQRMRNLQIQRNKLFARLYIKLNPGQKLRQNGAKWHFCNAMLGLNENTTVTDQSALAFLSTVYAFRCKSDSPLVEFMFVRKEQRDKWAGQKLKLPGGEVTLYATDSFNSEGKGVSYDEVAMSLLCEIRLTGGDYAEPEDILVIAKAIAGELTVHNVRAEDPAGPGFYGNQVWVITLDSAVGPVELAKIRELIVNYGKTRKYKFGVHQPRLARHPPCPCCLDDNHPRHKCPLLEQTSTNIELREKVRTPRCLEISVDEVVSLPPAVLPATEEEYHSMQEREFARLEPEIMKARTMEAEAAAAAASVELETAKATLLKIETLKEAKKAIEETTAAEQATAATGSVNGAPTVEGPKEESKEKPKEESGDDAAHATDEEKEGIKRATSRKKKNKKGGKKGKNDAGSAPEDEVGTGTRGTATGGDVDSGSLKDKEEMDKIRKQEAEAKLRKNAEIAAAKRRKEEESQSAQEQEALLKESAEARQKEEADVKAKRAEAEARKRREYEEARYQHELRLQAERSAKEKRASEEAQDNEADGKATSTNEDDEDMETAGEESRADKIREGEGGDRDDDDKGTAEKLAERAANDLAAALFQAMKEAEAKRNEAARKDSGAMRNSEKEETEVLEPSSGSHEAAQEDKVSRVNVDLDDAAAALAEAKREENEVNSGLQEAEPEGKSSRINVDLDDAAAALTEKKRDAEDGETSDGGERGEAREATDPPEVTELQQRARKKREARNAARKAKKRARRAEMEAKAAAARYLHPGVPGRQGQKVKQSTKLLDSLMKVLDADGYETEDDDDFEPMRPPSAVTGPTGQAIGKRVRVDTSEDPTNAGQPTTRPPARQMRTMTAHEYIVSKTNSKFLVAAKARAANKKASYEAPKPKHQLSVAAFLQAIEAPDDDGNVHMRTDSDVDRLEEAAETQAAMEAKELTDEEWRLARFSVFLARHGLHEVVTPPTGSCLAYACYAMKAAKLDAETMPMTRTSLKEANFYRCNLALYIIQHFDHLVGTDDYPLSEASFMLLGTTEVDELTIPRIIEHLRKDAKLQCDKICGREFWGTELHIRALVHWCKEPVYVCSVLPRTKHSTWEMAVQRYTYDPETNRVRVEQVSVADTVRCLKVYYAKKVLPLILVLRVSGDGQGNCTSHYNGVRTQQAHYDEWSGSRRKAADMKSRLQEVVDLIQREQLSTPEEVVLPAEWKPVDESSSVYTPSESEVSGKTEQGGEGGVQSGERDEARSIDGLQEVVDVATPTPQAQRAAKSDEACTDAEADGGAKSTGKKTAEEPLTQLNGSPVISTPAWSEGRVFTTPTDLPVSPVQPVSKDPIQDAQMQELLDRLKDREPIQKKEKEYLTFARASAANRTAYAGWKRSQKAEDPALAQRLNGLHTAWDACVALSGDAMAVLPLLRALPYAHVLMATLDKATIETIGEAFECYGRVQMLHRLARDTRISEPGRDFCLQWAKAVEGLHPLAMQRRESERADSWSRLHHFVRQTAPLPMSPERVARLVEPPEWYHAVAFAIALPQHLPSGVRCLPIDQVCDEALCWLASTGHIDFTRAVGEALVSRDWDAISALFSSRGEDEPSESTRRRATDPAAHHSLERAPQGPHRY